MHPDLVTVTVYTPAVIVLIVSVVDPVLQRYVPPPPPTHSTTAVLPAHTAGLLAVGAGLVTAVTVPCAVAEHPEALVTVTVYVPAVVVVILSTVAPVLHMYEVPPVAVSVTVAPEQLVALLTVGVGRELTVTVVVTVVGHPELVTVYDIVAVPAATPVTMPPETVATEVLDELHTPPVVTSDSVVVLPGHTDVVPVIAATTGYGLIVTAALP
jgi:hypothetical protein